MHPLDILFWSTLLLGGLYTLVTLLMGGLSHAVGDAVHHVGDTGNFSHLPDVGGDHGIGTGDHVHLEAGDHAADGHHGDGDTADGGKFHLLQYLNPMAVAGFLLGFGGAGMISKMLGVDSALGRVLCGAAAGLSLWLFTYLLVARLFAGAEGTSHNRREDIIGLRAQVTTSISGNKPGMVQYTIAGTRQSVRAVTDDEEPIPPGATVRIRRIENHTAHVVRVDEATEYPLLR